MAKNERVRIYNKGTRSWPLPDGKDKDGKNIMVECAPGKSIELNKKQADTLVKNYPDDFLAGEPVQATNDNKKLKAENSKLQKENATLRQQIISRDEKITGLEAEKTTAKDAKKLKTDWS